MEFSQPPPSCRVGSAAIVLQSSPNSIIWWVAAGLAISWSRLHLPSSQAQQQFQSTKMQLVSRRAPLDVGMAAGIISWRFLFAAISLSHLIARFYIISISMSDNFQQLAHSLAANPALQSQDLRDYALFVLEHIPNIYNAYRTLFATQLQQSMLALAKSVKDALNSRQANQIGPKLQLIYTTVINQQPAVNQYLTNIAKVLLNQKEAQDCEGKDKRAGLKYTETSHSSKFVGGNDNTNTQDTFCMNRQKTLSMKGRSLSNGSQRRKLSKVSYFAQAKKVEIPRDNFLQAQTTQGFFKHDPSKQIKKTKKKQDNFVFLQKCMSSTSPSNFMLNYLATHQPQHSKEQQPTRRRSSDKKDEPLEESVVIAQNQRCEQTQQLNVPSNNPSILNDSHLKNESGTYQKMMMNFQEKIGQKLDELMSKYSKIEQKLQQVQKHQPPRHQIKTQHQFSISVRSPEQPKPKAQLSNTVLRSAESVHSPLVDNRTNFVERQAKKEYREKETKEKETKEKQSKEKQNKEKEPPKVKLTTSSTNKSILAKAKILRNQIEESCTQQDEIDLVTLPKTSLKSLELQQPKSRQPQMLESKIVAKHTPHKQSHKQQLQQEEEQRKQVQSNHNYIVKQILLFSKTTAKVILPISKKLLFIVRKKYALFCAKNKLTQNPQMKALECQQVQNQAQELQDSLQKMQKVLHLKCTEQKKQKLLLYVCSFLDSYLSFSADGDIRQLANEVMSEQAAKNKIKQAMSSLQ